MTLSEAQESDREGILPPHSPPLSPLDPRAPHSHSELVPILDQNDARVTCALCPWLT